MTNVRYIHVINQPIGPWRNVALCSNYPKKKNVAFR